MPDNLEIAQSDAAAWPPEQVVLCPDPQGVFHCTVFADAGEINPRLGGQILALARAPEHRAHRGRSLGGTKVYHLEDWGSAEADLLTARARELFRRATGSREAVVDVSWANVYDSGDYVVPHSHVRAEASIVYIVDEGEPSPDDPASGRFTFVDPRIASACQLQKGHMTHALVPNMAAGTMIVFPGRLVHCVNPYSGSRPRISITWNVNRVKIPGSMREVLARQRRPEAPEAGGPPT